MYIILSIVARSALLVAIFSYSYNLVRQRPRSDAAAPDTPTPTYANARSSFMSSQPKCAITHSLPNCAARPLLYYTSHHHLPSPSLSFIALTRPFNLSAQTLCPRTQGTAHTAPLA